MKFNKFNTFVFLTAFLIIVDLLVGLNINAFYIRAVLAFLFITIVPGLLIMLIMKIREVGFWEYLVYTIGLSISFIMFAGLAVNWILPWLNITDKPLSLWPILISFNIFLIIMGYFAYKRNQDLEFEPKFPELDWINNIFFIIPMLFPVMAILGAFILNNNGPNTLTMIMLGSIAVYVFALVLFRNRLNENVYPWALYLISLSLLLMYSMRSWYFMGNDINHEFKVFQITKEIGFWSISNVKDAYNACLSITLLPAFISHLIEINDTYIYKALVPIIFSFIPVILNSLFKRYVKKDISFIASFLFISQLSFIIETYTHIRQGFAFIFLGLAFLALLEKNSLSKMYKILFMIFGCSMILSHYSTSYIAISLFLLTYLSTRIYKFISIKRKNNKTHRFNLSGAILIGLLIFGFIWYSQITNTSSGLLEFSKKSISNLNQLFSSEVQEERGSLIDQFNPFYKSPSKDKILRDYLNESIEKQENKNLYNNVTNTRYITRTMSVSILDSEFSPKITKNIYLGLQIIKIIIQIFFIVGILYILFSNKAKIRSQIEFVTLVIFSFFLLFLSTFLPFASVDYGLLRVYQQALIIGAVIGTIGGFVLLNIFKIKRPNLIVTTIFLIYFLFASGFLVQIVGYSIPTGNLNNKGDFYERFYITKSNLIAGEWLMNNKDQKLIVSMTSGTNTKIHPFLTINNIDNKVFPNTMRRTSYAFGTKKEIENKRGFVKINGKIVSYNFPIEFLEENKNGIYNNGDGKIFR